MKDLPPKDSAGRLRHARIEAGFKSARSAALRFGWTPSTYASHENGQTPVPQDAAKIYADAFRISFVWLLTGEHPGDDLVQIEARVSSAGDIRLVDEKNAQWVLLPFGISPPVYVLQVYDDSLFPRYDKGDVILCRETLDQIEHKEILIGREVVLVTPEGGLLGRIAKGRRGSTYDLEGFNRPRIHDVDLFGVYYVVSVARARAVELVNPGRAKALKAGRRKKSTENLLT